MGSPWDGDDLFMDRSCGEWSLRKLSDSLLCRGSGHGFPEAECGCVLAHPTCWTDVDQQLFPHRSSTIGMDSLSTPEHHHACRRTDHLDSECSASGRKFDFRRDQ